MHRVVYKPGAAFRTELTGDRVLSTTLFTKHYFFPRRGSVVLDLMNVVIFLKIESPIPAVRPEHGTSCLRVLRTGFFNRQSLLGLYHGEMEDRNHRVFMVSWESMQELFFGKTTPVRSGKKKDVMLRHIFYSSHHIRQVWLQLPVF